MASEAARYAVSPLLLLNGSGKFFIRFFPLSFFWLQFLFHWLDRNQRQAQVTDLYQRFSQFAMNGDWGISAPYPG
jgi:hypothetical protein